MELKGVLFGLALCLVGLVLFVYGLVLMPGGGVVSSLLPIVVGMFLGMAGLLVLALNLFSQGSLFS